MLGLIESMVRETTNLLLGIRKLNPTFLLLLFRQKKRNIRQVTDRQTDNKPKRKKNELILIPDWGEILHWEEN